MSVTTCVFGIAVLFCGTVVCCVWMGIRAHRASLKAAERFFYPGEKSTPKTRVDDTWPICEWHPKDEKR